MAFSLAATKLLYASNPYCAPAAATMIPMPPTMSALSVFRVTWNCRRDDKPCNGSCMPAFLCCCCCCR